MKVIRVCEASEISSPTGPTAHPAKRARRSTSTSMTIPTVSETADEYSIRFMLSEQEDTLLPISLDTMWQRSDTYSDYSQCYNSENSKNKTADKSEDGLQDPFSKAVAQLHISVLPAALPCREEEQKKVFNFLKSAMSEGGRKRPLYISGMPGTVKLEGLVVRSNVWTYYFLLYVFCFRGKLQLYTLLLQPSEKSRRSLRVLEWK